MFRAICRANNSYLDYLINSVTRCSRVQIIVLKGHTTAQIQLAHGCHRNCSWSNGFYTSTVRYDNKAHQKFCGLCGKASCPPSASGRSTPVSNETSLSLLLSDSIHDTVTFWTQITGWSTLLYVCPLLRHSSVHSIQTQAECCSIQVSNEFKSNVQCPSL